jgi:hypothetical protein
MLVALLATSMMLSLHQQVLAQRSPSPRPPLPPLPSPPSPSSPCRPDSRLPNTTQPQREALMQFFNLLNGPYWLDSTKWGSETDICDWSGVSCCLPLEEFNGAYCIPDNPFCNCKADLLGLVTGISLPGNNVSGSGMGGFGAAIGNMDALECSIEVRIWVPLPGLSCPSSF